MSAFHQGNSSVLRAKQLYKKRKSRFSYSEIKLLLEEVRKHRHIVVGKFNHGVPSNLKKRTWADITARINGVSQCPREIIEVIKKWSDMKCDVKRRLAARCAGGGEGPEELTPVEAIIHQILELTSTRQRHPPQHRASSLGRGLGARAGIRDKEGATASADSVSVPASAAAAAAESFVTSLPEMPLLSPAQNPAPTPMYCIASRQESTASSYELQYEIQTIEDEDVESIDLTGEEIGVEESRPSLPSSSAPPAEEGTPLLGGSHRRGAPAPHPSLAHRGGVSTREEIVRNAAQSVQEQRTSNELLRSVSRSMELLSESLQQAVETQQDFVRDSLALQRESLQVLRDFASAALTTLQEKLNGHPAPRR
ncbi:nuclear apoptosis-inducing factor 1-like [Acipenser ruthenus]|uniref:nuclear apoptosis-inducing factor 1-like n=1 Tax=Acipenser ruthenus TaxID=7906 RepID=UPI00145B3EC5|nr:nuclear apoptosis-inducing factor 1-like [Acipenser ruthenus]XP_033848801.1 nuclear apoptosis-inducing factor 1-like [Acipenser ruthenus]